MSSRFCKFCNAPVTKKPNVFCSQSCAAKYNNTNRTVTSRKPTSSNDGRRGQRVCKVSFCESCGVAIKNQRIKFCNLCREISRKQKLSIHAKRRGLGGVRPSKRIRYKNEILGSTYELFVAKSLDQHQIKWCKSIKFNYTDKFGNTRTYEPDFYLPDFDIYLDPKNDFLIENINPSLGFTDQEKILIVERTHNIKVIILNKHQLEWSAIQELIRRR